MATTARGSYLSARTSAKSSSSAFLRPPPVALGGMRRILRPSAAIRSRSEAAACWLAEQIDVAEQPAGWRGRFGRFGGNPGLYRQSREGFGQIPSAIRAIFYHGRVCGLLAPISGSTAAPFERNNITTLGTDFGAPGSLDLGSRPPMRQPTLSR